MNMFIQLGKLQTELFEKDNVAYVEYMVKGNVMLEIFNCCYNSLVQKNLLVPVEKLSVDEKRELWLQAKDTAAGRLDNEKCIRLSKAIYTIYYFLNQ